MFKRKLDERNRGEDIAVLHLQKLGWKILVRNYRIRGREIDIIAIDLSISSGQDSDTLAFIEVKTRTSNQFDSGLEAIIPWKLKALIKSAQFYKASHRNLPDLMRIDAVVVMLDSDNQTDSVELFKNIGY